MDRPLCSVSRGRNDEGKAGWPDGNAVGGVRNDRGSGDEGGGIGLLPVLQITASGSGTDGLSRPVRRLLRVHWPGRAPSLDVGRELVRQLGRTDRVGRLLDVVGQS